jgi:DNA (cytosine-5)-methyltransferase 1
VAPNGNEIPFSEFMTQREIDNIVNKIRSSSSTFIVPDLMDIERRLGFSFIKGVSQSKADIMLDIFAANTDMLSQGFGIKSLLGAKPTLLNASKATNITFCLEDLTPRDIASINSITELSHRVKAISDRSQFSFHAIDRESFRHNLICCDSQLPNIVAASLVEYFVNRTTSLKENISNISKQFPNIDQTQLTVIFKKMLISIMLGFNPATKWNANYSAHGTIVLLNNGLIRAFHIVDAGRLKDYLLNNTKFETSGTKRHLYSDNGKVHIKLNLQIRFK